MNNSVDVKFILSLIDEKLKENKKLVDHDSFYTEGMNDGLKWIRKQLVLDFLFNNTQAEDDSE
jgi:hypothetical protein